MANWSRLDDRKNSLRKLIHWRSQSFCHQGMFFASRIKVAKKATKAVKDSSAIAMGVGKGESTTSKASFMVLGMTQATADTEYHANHMGLKHWQNLHPCDFCPADAIEGSNYNCSDFGPAWMQEQATRDEYMGTKCHATSTLAGISTHWPHNFLHTPCSRLGRAAIFLGQ